jgi:hypothetical protein
MRHEVTALAARQHGVVTARQLHDAGARDHALRSRGALLDLIVKAGLPRPLTDVHVHGYEVDM